MGADEFLIAFVSHLVGHHLDLGDADVFGQLFDPAKGLHRPGARFDDHDELIHHAGGAAA